MKPWMSGTLAACTGAWNNNSPAAATVMLQTNTVLANPLCRRPTQASFLKDIGRQSCVVGNRLQRHLRGALVSQILHDRLRDRGRTLNRLVFLRLIDLVEFPLQIVMLHLQRQMRGPVNPEPPIAELRPLWTFWCALDHERGMLPDSFLAHQLMRILVKITAGYILVGEIGAGKAGPLVARRNPLDQVNGRDIKPSVIIPTRVFCDQEAHPFHIGRLMKIDVIGLLTPIGL